MTKQTTIVLTLLVAALAGCARDIRGERLLLVEMPKPVVEPDPADPLPVAPLREVTHVDVESFNGDVVIVADRKRKSLEVSLKREAVHGWGREKEAKNSLKEIAADVQTSVDEYGRHVVIKTSTTHPEPHYQRANLLIEAPAIGDVIVKTSRGKVSVTDCQGTVNIETTRGDVRVITHWPMRQPVTIVTNDADIDYRVRAESTGRFDAQTADGRVMFRQRYGHWTMQEAGSTEDRMLAVLNEGENPIVLRTSHGNVRVAVVSDPAEVGYWIVEP